MPDLLTLPRAAAAAAFGAGTLLRGRRVFHPRGSAAACRVAVHGGGTWGSGVLDHPAELDGVVRLSRGLGLPRPLPDVDGLALRLPGRGVGGEPLDLLINSAWRFAFVPSVLSGTWSTVLPYRTGTGRLVLLGARPRPGGFWLLAASPTGSWHPWGHLDLAEPVEGEQLRFRPTVGAGDLQPVPLFRTLRAWSYGTSQALRQ